MRVVGAKRPSCGLVKKIGFAFLKARWVVFLAWGSERQDRSVILGNSTGGVMIQHSIALAQKATLGPVQTSSRIILGSGRKVVKPNAERKEESPQLSSQLREKLTRTQKQNPW